MADKQQIHTCPVCSSEFIDFLSNNRKYCSRKCAYSTFHKDYKHICEYCKTLFYTKKKNSKYCSASCWAKEVAKDRPAWNKGIKYTQIRGSNHWNWQGGKPRDLRLTTEYKDWRKAVFEKDNYTCQLCNVRGGKLIADHIKPFSKYPELRLELSNGRALCVNCNHTVTYVTKEWRTA